MKYKVTTCSQERFFETNNLEMAKEAAKVYAVEHQCSTFIWRKGQSACTYWVSYRDGSSTMYRGAGRK